MHNSLKGLPSRVVIDANLILNAAFVPGSAARQALTKLEALGFMPVIDASIEYEAREALVRITKKRGLLFDPMPALSDALDFYRVIRLPAAPRRYLPNVNRADQHVVCAADHFACWVLTGDVGLAAECQVGPVPARLPWDVIMEVDAVAGRDPPLQHIAHFAGIGHDRGTVFARVIPGGWGSSGLRSGRFMVCSIEHVGALYYDADCAAWAFKLIDGPLALAYHRLTGEEQSMVCGTYEIDRKTGKAAVTVRSTKVGKQSVVGSVVGRASLGASCPGTLSVGSTQGGGDHWNGYIRRIVVNPLGMTGKTWKALCKVPEAAPDPTAIRTVESVLALVNRGLVSIAGSTIDLTRFWV